MGIGVTYYGSNGKKRSFNVESMADVRAADKDLGNAPRRPSREREIDFLEKEESAGKISMGEGMPAKYLSDQIMPNSGISFGPNGMCLAGEENGAKAEGGSLYGVDSRGKKGFVWLGDIDPIGDLKKNDKNEDGSPADTSWQAGGRGGSRLDWVTHVCINRPDRKLYECYVTVTLSSNGRIVDISPEKRRVISTLYISGELGDGREGANQ